MSTFISRRIYKVRSLCKYVACCFLRTKMQLAARPNIRRRSDYIIGFVTPSNRSKQIRETHTADSAGTQYTRQSLNEKQPTCMASQTTTCLCSMLIFIQTLPRIIVCRRCQPCEFLGFVWTDCWGSKSNYVITSPANTQDDGI